MIFSIISASVGLAHATIGLAASQAALSALSIGDSFLAGTTLDQPQCLAIVSYSPPTASSVISAAVEEIKEEEEEDLDAVEITNHAPSSFNSIIADASAHSNEIGDADLAALCTGFEKEMEEELVYNPVAAGHDAVFAAVVGAGGSSRQTDEAVAFYLRCVNRGTPVQDAVALATGQAMRALAAEAERVEGVCAAYEQGGRRGRGGSLLGAWASSDPQAYAVFALGTQAAVVVGGCALAVGFVATCAVGGLAVLGAHALFNAATAGPSADSGLLALASMPSSSAGGGAVTPFLPSITLPALSREDFSVAAKVVAEIAVEAYNGTLETVAWVRRRGGLPAPVTPEEAAAQAAWCGVSAHADGKRRFVC